MTQRDGSAALREARRIVVKVGSSLVTDEGRGLDERAIGEWSRQLAALAVGQVGMRQQHLRRGHAVLAQLGLVHLRQAHLADGGGGLQLVQFVRTAGPAQALHALGDGAAGHHDHLAALGGERGQLPAPFADGALVQPAALVGDQAGTHLDDDAPGLARRGAHRRGAVPAGDGTGIASPSPGASASKRGSRSAWAGAA